MSQPTISLLTKKRLRQDFKLLHKEPDSYFEAYPREDNILEWDFLIKGPKDSHYTGGYYVGKIMHNPEYPLKPPDFMMRTPSGRFDIEKKICLTNSGYHSSDWSPMWTIHAILAGFLSIMLDDVDNGISHIKQSKEARVIMANNSIEFNKKYLGDVIKKFTRFLDEEGNPKPDKDSSSSSSSTKQEMIKAKAKTKAVIKK